MSICPIFSVFLNSCLVLLGGSGDDEEHIEQHIEEHKRKRQVIENTVANCPFVALGLIM